eukprot:RCo035021
MIAHVDHILEPHHEVLELLFRRRLHLPHEHLPGALICRHDLEVLAVDAHNSTHLEVRCGVPLHLPIWKHRADLLPAQVLGANCGNAGVPNGNLVDFQGVVLQENCQDEMPGVILNDGPRVLHHPQAESQHLAPALQPSLVVPGQGGAQQEVPPVLKAVLLRAKPVMGWGPRARNFRGLQIVLLVRIDPGGLHHTVLLGTKLPGEGVAVVKEELLAVDAVRLPNTKVPRDEIICDQLHAKRELLRGLAGVHAVLERGVRKGRLGGIHSGHPLPHQQLRAVPAPTLVLRHNLHSVILDVHNKHQLSDISMGGSPVVPHGTELQLLPTVLVELLGLLHH